jgi:hypothetical protein
MAQVLNGGSAAAAAADAATTITTDDSSSSSSSSARLAFIANVLIGYKVEAQVRLLMEQLSCARRRPSRHAHNARARRRRTHSKKKHSPACDHAFPQPKQPQLHNGLVYEGVFHTLKAEEAGGKQPSGGLSVVVKHARVVRDPAVGGGAATSAAGASQQLAERPSATLVLRAAELASVLAKDVRMAPEDLGAEADADGAFATDSAISRGRGG